MKIHEIKQQAEKKYLSECIKHFYFLFVIVKIEII